MTTSAITREIFVEGLGSIMLGYPISKLTFFSNAAQGNAPIQQSNLVLSMPTGSMLALIVELQKNFSQNDAALIEGIKTSQQQFATLKAIVLKSTQSAQQEKAP